MIESITDCAFSCPISVKMLCQHPLPSLMAYRMMVSFARTLVVIDYISQVIPSAVVRLSHTHGVVCEVDIAVVAWRLGRSVSSR